jgi:hypothetical protein
MAMAAEGATTSATKDRTTGNARGGAKKSREKEGVPGFGVTLFFVFMLTYFAIFLLMYCTIATTLIGMALLFLALSMTIAGYVAGA